jgi:hypothetical protein
MHLFYNNPYTYGTARLVAVIFAIICFVILPLANFLFTFFNLGKKPNQQVELDEQSSNVLSEVKVQGNKLVLTKKGDITNALVDVVYYSSKKKTMHSYKVTFDGNVAVIEPGIEFEAVRVIVIKADTTIINKKKIGYLNEVLHIVTSVGIAIGIIVPSVLFAVYYSYALTDFYPDYATVYIVPIIVGLVLGVINYFGGKLLTKSFTFGGKK